ncbi:MAG: peptidylprolyl isomerase [Aureliella sp.]
MKTRFLKSRSRRNRLQTRAHPPTSRVQRALGSTGFEPLESRKLLAADIGMSHLFADQIDSSEFMAASVLVAEGEAPAPGPETGARDLVSFAQELTNRGVSLYCAEWSEDCTQQLELFQDGGKFINLIESTDQNRELTQEAIDAGITVLPTWEFSDGSRETGIQTLDQLSLLSGLSIPFSSQPSFAPLGNQFVGIGSPLHLPIDAYDPNGGLLTVSVESSNPELLSAEVLTGNRSLELSVAGYGDMVFELFEGRAPRPSGRVIELAESGFYDGTIFHRVIEDFVIQGGDPTGTGRGGSTLGDFDDQYHLDLQHNATGMLSYAKSQDDTNDSQFFITDRPVRHLDFNHSVFGILVEGEENRAAIETIATDNADRPNFDVTLESASIFEDEENSVVVLRPTGNGSGVVTLTVTVRDEDGNEVSESIDVEVGDDTANGGPFLNDIDDLTTCPNHAVQLQLTSQDKEGDEVTYAVQQLGDVAYELEVDAATGLVTVTPPADFIGEFQFAVGVRQTSSTTTASTFDTQIVSVTVESSHQNPNNQFDVNDDGFVTPIDALIIINHINSGEPTSVGDLGPPPDYFDANADCSISPIDALLVINELNSLGSGEGEGQGTNQWDGHTADVHFESYLAFLPAEFSTALSPGLVQRGNSPSTAMTAPAETIPDTAADPQNGSHQQPTTNPSQKPLPRLRSIPPRGEQLSDEQAVFTDLLLEFAAEMNWLD